METQVALLSNHLGSIRDLITRIQKETEEDISRTAAGVSSQLQLILGTLFRLAVFVRGDYDNRPDDTEQKTRLLNELTGGCGAVEKLTVHSLTLLGQLHATAVELRDTQVRELSQNISKSLQEIRSNISTYKTQIETLAETARTQKQTLDNEIQVLATLSSKLGEAEALQQGIDIGVSILVPIWGIVNLIDHDKGPGSVGPLRDMVASARQGVESAASKVKDTLNALAELEAQAQRLTILERAQEALGQELPAQAALVDAIIQRINTMEVAFVAAKASALEAARRSGMLENAAVMTSHFSISKKDFVEGILDVTEALVMDSKTASAAGSVLDELVNEYGGNGMPKELQDRSVAIKTNMLKIQPA